VSKTKNVLLDIYKSSLVKMKTMHVCHDITTTGAIIIRNCVITGYIFSLCFELAILFFELLFCALNKSRFHFSRSTVEPH